MLTGRSYGGLRVTSTPCSSTPPGVGELEAGDHAQRRRLARAGGPEHREELARAAPPATGARWRPPRRRSCASPPSRTAGARGASPGDAGLRARRVDRRTSAGDHPEPSLVAMARRGQLAALDNLPTAFAAPSGCRLFRPGLSAVLPRCATLRRSADFLANRLAGGHRAAASVGRRPQKQRPGGASNTPGPAPSRSPSMPVDCRSARDAVRRVEPSAVRPAGASDLLTRPEEADMHHRDRTSRGALPRTPSDELVLAAVERAERHRPRPGAPASLRAVLEHLAHRARRSAAGRSVRGRPGEAGATAGCGRAQPRARTHGVGA